ncbi:YidC/Oxa1 family insertase periplasmic-domain containing protein [Gemmata sp. JC673]|uniref:Membrane protein insertase YidC n=1 Tax=Gemmata algarum TaxID=2975278 RepID=A0ABU5EXU2_9BACT|nr:YidC/Oxa1 family insertase periplasmic-domain containing protein [Gemmata algarum]MDY3559759.1 YidC/Oxa1 family insertase periplasmic-domain containing protein [Gemmata algarum]
MRKNVLNVIVFLFLAAGLFFLWRHAEENWMPKPVPQKDPAEKMAEELQKQADEQAKRQAEEEEKRKLLAATGGGLAVGIELPKPKPPEPPKAPVLTVAGVEPRVIHNAIVMGVFDAASRPTLIALGDGTFYNRVLLTTRGGGVQQVVLPKFGQADRLGREVKVRDKDGNPTTELLPLHLIPGIYHPRAKHLREDYQPPDLVAGPVANPVTLAEPCFTVFHYPTPDDNNPDPLLGETNWTVVSEKRPADGPHEVVFEKELGEPYFVKIRKTYTLARTDYHIGLHVGIEKLKVPGAAKGKGQLKYQLSGPRGLPIEGEWYTSTYRVAIVGWRERNGTLRRQYEDAASIGSKRGGEKARREDNTFHYMAVANQFFASAVAIDYSADEAKKSHPWSYVRATTELPLDKKQDPQMPNFDDITVRAASETIDLEPGQSATHRYFIYNGPAKVGLLKLLPKVEIDGQKVPAVREELVDQYKDTMMMSTITDFRSDTAIGRFASFIFWTDLVIAMTNLMHILLAAIHSVLGSWAGSWALSIVMLTVCVRLVLMYPSRKQTAMSMKMMEVQKRLQPEFEKLQEKYKDDFNSYNREKTRLMMANGANPFAMAGGCLLLFAQMPVMMGLYFCLQESIFFRLDSFLWIDNLAAPDMLKWWTEQIPYVSTPDDIGSFIYLGPYFNLLPLLAVGLMLYQQSKMMPPATDPQAEQQRMMMKLMMIMMAVFFYKVAAGLALYFIVSTAWAIIERQLIPKPVIDTSSPAPAAAAAGSKLSPTGPAVGKMTTEEALAAAKAKNKGFLTRLREALQAKMEEMQRQADEQAKRQIRNDRPGEGPSPPPGASGPQPDNRRDKKNRRRKK